MNQLRQSYTSLTREQRWALWIVLMLGVALSVFASQLIGEIFAPDTSLRVRVADLIPVTLAILAFVSAGLFLSGKTYFATWLVYIPTLLGLLGAVILAEGYGFAAASVALVVTLYLPTQVFKGRLSSVALLIGLLTSILIILTDTFIPTSFARISPEDARSANILALLFLIIVLIGLASQYRRFPLRTKLIVAFIGLTSISVGLIAAQSITINTRNLSRDIGMQASQVAQEKASLLGNELNRLVNLLIVASNDAGLQQFIIESNQSYAGDREIRNQVVELSRQWDAAYQSGRNDPLIYSRLTNPAAIDLRILTARTQALGDLFVTDRYGALVGTMKVIRQFDYYNEPWWQKAYNAGKGSIYIGLPEYNEELQKITLLIAVPVIDRVNNYIIGVLGTVYPFDLLKSKLKADLSNLGPNTGIDLIFPGSPPLVLAESEQEICQKNNRQLQEFTLGSAMLTVVASSENSFLQDLSQDQLRRVFSSALTWAEIDPSWPPEPISRLVPNPDTGTFDVFIDNVLYGNSALLVNSENLTFFDSEEALVEEIRRNPNAIGVVSYGIAEKADDLKIVAINGAKPNSTSVESKPYPLNQNLYVYTDKTSLEKNPALATFLNYLLNHAAEELTKIGYRPVNQELAALNQKRWADLTKNIALVEDPKKLSGKIMIHGSSALHPVMTTLAENFKRDGFLGSIEITNSDTASGITNLCTTGNIDLINASRKVKKEPNVLAEPYILQALRLAESEKYFQMNYAGSDSLVSVAEMNDIHHSDYIYELDWKISVHNPVQDALAPIETQRRASTGLLLVVAGIAIAGALGLTYLLSTPLHRLSEVAQKFGAGNMDLRAQVETEDEIGTLATAFNDMADRIQSILANLEEQVAERTRAVVTGAEVSRRLSTILDQRRLLLSVVDEIQNAFNFYHVQIYLLDPDKRSLIMMGGTGEAGQVMMSRGHQIDLGKGLVGKAAETHSTILVNNTETNPDWLPNPLLPETKSEAAIPIAIGDQVLGVLDVQHNVSLSFNDLTVDLLESIANQVAIAIQNARLFSEAQKQAEREALILSINQKIQAETTIEKVLETAVRELSQALAPQKATIQIDPIAATTMDNRR